MVGRRGQRRPTNTAHRSEGEYAVSYADHTNTPDLLRQPHPALETSCCAEAIQFRRFPQALIERPQWVLWKYEDRGGKRTKLPYQPNGTLASTTDHATWSTLGAVQEARWACIGRWSGPHYDGVGFVFAHDDPFVGIDLDHCRGEGWAAELLARLPTYVEITPSLTGYHLIGLGQLPEGKGKRHGQIEVYDRGRYFTMTGMMAAGSTSDPQDLQPLVDELLAEWAPAVQPRTHSVWTPTLETNEILRRALLAKNGEKVARLYQGDTDGYASKSEADFALIELMIFYTRDPGQLDSLFRNSGLMDEKWDSLRGSETYGGLTIGQALARQSAYYRERDEAPGVLSLRSEPYDATDH